ncbi:hypothetical protein [Nostoc sp.]
MSKKLARSPVYSYCGCCVSATPIASDSRGDGVIELIEKLITSDLAEFGH